MTGELFDILVHAKSSFSFAKSFFSLHELAPVSL